MDVCTRTRIPAMTTSQTALTPLERFTDAMRQLVRAEFALHMGTCTQEEHQRAETAVQDAFMDAVLDQVEQRERALRAD